MIKLIIALGPNNLIGIGNKMAWHIPAEFKHFKDTTIGHSLLFGKNTFLGLPKKLEGRKIYVLSDMEIDGADYTIKTVEELVKLFAKYKNSKDVLFIAGGKSIYEQFYMYADELIISHVKTSASGDVYLNWDLSNYEKTLLKSEQDFDVYSYRVISKKQ